MLRVYKQVNLSTCLHVLIKIQSTSYSTDLLNQIGFKDVVVNDMVEKPTLDTIRTVIAHKNIDGYDVVSVAIRGEKYDSE